MGEVFVEYSLFTSLDVFVNRVVNQCINWELTIGKKLGVEDRNTTVGAVNCPFKLAVPNNLVIKI